MSYFLMITMLALSAKMHKGAYFDCNDNQTFEEGVDLALPKKGYQSKPFFVLDGRGECSNGEDSSFVLPKSARIKAYQLAILADRDILIHGKLQVKFRNGNRPRPSGNMMGALVMLAEQGRIVVGPEVKLKFDLLAMEAAGDIVFSKHSRTYQFQNAFAKPMPHHDRVPRDNPHAALRDPSDYNFPDQVSLPFEQGPQLLLSGGSVVMEEGSSIIMNDRLTVVAEELTMAPQTELHTRNHFIGDVSSFRATQGAKRKHKALLRSGRVELLTSQVQLGTVLGVKKGTQCKLGGGHVPGCVGQEPTLSIEGGEPTPLPIR